MFMVTDTLKVGLLTDHVPVKDAPALITGKRVVEKIEAMESSLVRDFGVSKPKIAVLGINPHTLFLALMRQILFLLRTTISTLTECWPVTTIRD